MPADAILSPGRSREEKERILRKRAGELARPLPAAPAVAEGIEVLAFSLARKNYALPTTCVREVQRLHNLTPLPGAPPLLLGLVDVRGQILAVLDLRQLLDQPTKDLTDLGQLIILRRQDLEFGILADAIVGTRILSTAGLLAPEPSLRACRGLSPEGLILLDGDQLLADPRLHMEEEMAR